MMFDVLASPFPPKKMVPENFGGFFFLGGGVLFEIQIQLFFFVTYSFKKNSRIEVFFSKCVA